MSLADFRCSEYSDGKVSADPEVRNQIIEIGIRRVARERKVDRETVAFIARGGRVRASTLAKVVAYLSDVSV